MTVYLPLIQVIEIKPVMGLKFLYSLQNVIEVLIAVLSIRKTLKI